MFLNAVLDLRSCLKAIFAIGRGHGKSPCFLDINFLIVFGVDKRHYFSVCVNGGFHRGRTK
jgi:hypothetical protein